MFFQIFILEELYVQFFIILCIFIKKTSWHRCMYGTVRYGTVHIFSEHLQMFSRQMGGWLEVNGEAVYNSVPWSVQNDTVNSKVNT